MKSRKKAKWITCIICGFDCRTIDSMVQHLASEHSYKERTFFNLEWIVEEHLYDDLAEVRCSLSDKTRCGRFLWEQWKVEMMRPTYQHSKDYKMLCDEDRVLMDDLREA